MRQEADSRDVVMQNEMSSDNDDDASILTWPRLFISHLLTYLLTYLRRHW